MYEQKVPATVVACAAVVAAAVQGFVAERRVGCGRVVWLDVTLRVPQYLHLIRGTRERTTQREVLAVALA